MNKVPLTRGALLSAACAVLTMAAVAPADAQNFPPGTNCQSLLPDLRSACINQAQQMNSGSNTVIPNSAGSNTVPTPGTNSLNTGTGVAPSGVAPNGVTGPNAVIPNGTISPNAVTPNSTINPNAVTPNSTINPNAVGTPNSAAPTGNPVIIPPAGSGTMGTGAGTTGGASSGASGN
jgi:hypothetical protein